MKFLLTVIVAIFVAGCAEPKSEEQLFKETMLNELKEKCGLSNQACIASVRAQIDQCMEQGDWKSLMESDGNKAEMHRFVRDFFPCFKDPEGKAYFGNADAYQAL